MFSKRRFNQTAHAQVDLGIPLFAYDMIFFSYNGSTLDGEKTAGKRSIQINHNIIVVA